MSSKAELGRDVTTSFTKTDEQRVRKLESAIAELRQQMAELRPQIQQLHAAVDHAVGNASPDDVGLRNRTLPAALEGPFSTVKDTEIRADLESALGHLRRALATQPAAASMGVKIGRSGLPLSETEIRLLSSEAMPPGDIDQLIMVALAARALLTEQIEIVKHGTAVDFGPLLLTSGEVIQQMRRAGGRHGINHDAVATSARRLADLIRQAETVVQRTN